VASSIFVDLAEFGLQTRDILRLAGYERTCFRNSRLRERIQHWGCNDFDPWVIT
jgi:hypothetical protein